MQYELSELLPLLKDLTAKYTRNESTSVPYETAQQLMSAIIYCIDHAAQETASFGGTNSEMVASSSYVSINAIYEKGYALVVEKTKTAQILYSQILEVFNDYGNIAYRDTVKTSLLHFFKWYDPKFSPQDSVISLDYPTNCPPKEKEGIDEIYEYLKNIWIEQQLLSHMGEDFVYSALNQYHPNHRQLVFNLCIPVLEKILDSKLKEGI